MCVCVCVTEWCGRRGHRGQRRRGNWDWGSRKRAKTREEEEEEEDSREQAPSPFVTGRQQHVCSKKRVNFILVITAARATGAESAEEVWGTSSWAEWGGRSFSQSLSATHHQLWLL